MDATAPRRRMAMRDRERDEDLVAGLRRGDGPSYERAVRRHGGRMLAVARRLVQNEDDARDCVQDAFLHAFRNIDQFEGRSSLGTWLHRIVVNAALMRLRSRQRRPETSLEALMPHFDTRGCRIEPDASLLVPFDVLLESREARRLVRRAIDQLPSGYRNVLILRDIEEYGTEETAEILGMSPGAVKTRLHRARAALKKLLEPVLTRTEP